METPSPQPRKATAAIAAILDRSSILVAWLACLPVALLEVFLANLRISRERRRWPLTVDQAVARILRTWSPRMLTQLAGMPERGLNELHFTVALAIRNEFGMWAGNTSLMRDCALVANGREVSGPDGASHVVLRTLWTRLREGPLPRAGRWSMLAHRLRKADPVFYGAALSIACWMARSHAEAASPLPRLYAMAAAALAFGAVLEFVEFRAAAWLVSFGGIVAAVDAGGWLDRLAMPAPAVALGAVVWGLCGLVFLQRAVFRRPWYRDPVLVGCVVVPSALVAGAIAWRADATPLIVLLGWWALSRGLSGPRMSYLFR